MSDILYQYDDSMLERYSCDCLGVTHIMDLFIDGVNTKNPMVMLSFKVREQSLWQRVKYAWKLILARECCVDEFILRNPDIPQLIRSLTIAKEGS